MSKNLRQKYKEAKQKLRELNWRLLYPDKPLKVNNVPIHKVRSTKTVDIFEAEHARDMVMRELAFDLAKHMVDNGMISVSETVDPYSGRVYMFADLYVVDKKDLSNDA